MSTIIELRKQELTVEINKMICAVEFFIDNKKKDENATSISNYLDLNGKDLGDIKQTLHTIKLRFNPESDSFDTFENCINQLEELQKEITKIQSRGEAEQKRLQLNSESLEHAYNFAGIGAILGGIALGFGGCVSCISTGEMRPPDSNGPHIDIPLFNLITGILIGAISGAVIGVFIGAIKGGGEIARWFIVGCLSVGIPIVLGGIYFFNPTYDIPAIQANVTSIQFYESGDDNSTSDKRNYGSIFTKSKTRYVNWEIHLEYPHNRKSADFSIKAVLYSADDSIVEKQEIRYHVNADSRDTDLTYHWGQKKVGNWQVGSYRTDIFVDGKMIASDSFTVR